MQSGSTPTSSSNSLRKHLETEQTELQQRYDVLTKQIRANDLDLGRTLDSEKRLALEDRREELSTERISVVARMEQIETQLTQIAESTPPPTQAKEPEPKVEQPKLPVPTASPPTEKVQFVKQLPNPLIIDEPFHLELVHVPAGRFLFGPNNVTAATKEYYIGKYLITNAQYAVFVQQTGSKVPKKRWKDGKIPSGLENHPVIGIRYNDAVAFCQWLTSETGVRFGIIDEIGWEKAARGTDGRLYPWGNSMPRNDLCKFNSGRYTDTSPVDAHPKGASPYGALDMAGNVNEWTSTVQVVQGYVFVAFPMNHMVIRGGSCRSQGDGLQCTYRDNVDPDEDGWIIGFRVAHVVSVP